MYNYIYCGEKPGRRGRRERERGGTNKGGGKGGTGEGLRREGKSDKQLKLMHIHMLIVH